ncbi:hypothetical protein RRG08_003072 [Elysia crispata]|uniref:Uncharacterized protein n=1 Tax=Elysia crispata TaxID=231223 RepID=A0AAE1B7J3_9GAST|nr:hypothetical protein RRG08_003072 [Elysia crispata]
MDLATFKRNLLRQLVENAAGLMPAGERAKTPGCRNTQIERFQVMPPKISRKRKQQLGLAGLELEMEMASLLCQSQLYQRSNHLFQLRSHNRSPPNP